MMKIEKTLTAAEVLALNTTAITVIPAPGAGQAILVKSAHVRKNTCTTAYDGVAAGEDLLLKVENSSGATALTVETTGLLDATAEKNIVVFGTGHLITADKAVVAFMSTGNVATGNGTVDIIAEYDIVNL
jgi:hypothetical protein